MAARIARTSCPAPSEPSTTTRATSTATAAPNPRDRARARGRVQSAAGGSEISSRSRRKPSRNADPSRASQGDAEEPAAKRVIAPRRAAETLGKRLLKRILRELRVEQDGDERAVDRRIRGTERRLPSGGLVVGCFGHYLLG